MPAGPPSESRFVLRVSFGYAFGAVLLAACAQIHLGVFLAAYAALTAVGALRARGMALPRWSPEFRILLVLVGAYLVIRGVPVVVNELPIGWDTYFHLLFADRIAQTHQAIHDWLPYEDIPLNYPIGPHLILGLISWIAGIPAHFPFKVAIVWFTALTGVQLYALFATASSGNRRLALYGAAAYLFTADFGSFGYALWGGLPNLMGMAMFLALLALLAEDEGGWRETAAFAVFFVGVSILHHHCMVTAGIVLLWIFALVPRLRRRIAWGLAASAVLGAPYYCGYLARVGSLSATGIAGFNEPAMSVRDIAGSLSPIFFFACVFGALIFWRRRREYAVRPPLLASLTGFLLCFVVGDYLIRLGGVILYHKQLAPFTPSRFLTDAVMLLAFFAGVFYAALESWLALSLRQTLAVALAGFVFLLPIYRESFREDVSPPLRQAYEWIRNHSRPDAWVLDGADIHASYLTGRASSGVPIPTSEFAAQGRFRPALAALARGEGPELAKGREVFAVLRGNAGPADGFRVVWEGEGVRVAQKQ